MKNLNDYLRKYYELQEDILVVYRPTLHSSWANRCMYLTEEYDPDVEYNHRNILQQEVVIEYDTDDKEKNLSLAEQTIKNLKKDGIAYSLWFSGNKSYHVHFLINPKRAANLRLLKITIMRHYSEGLETLPDLRLATDNHLVRAEYGVHEKTGVHKTLLRKSHKYFQPQEVTSEVWDKYLAAMRTVVKRRVSTDLNQLNDCTCLKAITDVVKYRQNEDGRERGLVVIIQALKHQKTKEEMVAYAWDWYKYSGGYKLSFNQIRHKVYYQYKRDYKVETLVLRLLEELGRGDVIKDCPVHGG